MNLKKIAWFLLFAFGISWTTAAVLYFGGVHYGGITALVVVALLYMPAPAISALLVQKFIYRLPMKDLGLNFRETRWKQLLWTPLTLLFLLFFSIFMVCLFGNMLHIPVFGYFSLDAGLLAQRMKEIAAATGSTKVPSLPFSPTMLLMITVISSIFIGGVVNTIFTFGEELGWRGFLYNETQALGFIKSNLLIGTVWGFWHAPIILMGHNYPEHPVAGVFMMVPFCISLSFILSWLRARSNSVLTPSLLHGMINAAGGGMMLFCYEGNDLFGNVAGLAGAMGALLTLGCLLLLGKSFPLKPEISAKTFQEPEV